MRILLFFLVVFINQDIFAKNLICKLALKSALNLIVDSDHHLKSNSNEFGIVDDFRTLINYNARTGANNFFTKFNRTLEFNGPYFHLNKPLNAPILVLMEQNPNWDLDPDILNSLNKRRALFGPKQFSPHWFEEARSLSMDRLYWAYSEMGPEIKDNISSYRKQDEGTFATHIIFSLPVQKTANITEKTINEFDLQFPPTHEFIGRVQGIGSYSPEHKLNVEIDFENSLQLNRKKGELWVELGRAMYETKSDLSKEAQELVEEGGGWDNIQRTLFLKQILWLNHDVQPYAVVLHANAGMTKYLRRVTRLKDSLQVVHTEIQKNAVENVIQLSRYELLKIQRILFLEDFIQQVQRAIILQETKVANKQESFFGVLSVAENAEFKDLGLNYFFENPKHLLKVNLIRTWFGSEYFDLLGLSQFKVSGRDLKLFLKFLLSRQKELIDNSL